MTHTNIFTMPKNSQRKKYRHVLVILPRYTVYNNKKTTATTKKRIRNVKYANHRNLIIRPRRGSGKLLQVSIRHSSKVNHDLKRIGQTQRIRKNKKIEKLLTNHKIGNDRRIQKVNRNYNTQKMKNKENNAMQKKYLRKYNIFESCDTKF